jgi:uncharacterized protein YndB with AHSA1/START domain
LTDNCKLNSNTTAMSIITVNVLVNASLEKVWESWTNPQHIVNWNFASDDWHAPAAKNELTVGGNFTYTMAAKDESFSFDFTGKFTEITPNKSISYLLDDDRKVDITFELFEGQVMVIESFEAETQNPEDLQRMGWQAILDNFKKYTETL